MFGTGDQIKILRALEKGTLGVRNSTKNSMLVCRTKRERKFLLRVLLTTQLLILVWRSSTNSCPEERWAISKRPLVRGIARNRRSSAHLSTTTTTDWALFNAAQNFGGETNK